MKKKIKFEEAMQRLEEIASILADGAAPLDQSLALYSEGAELIAFCDKQLADAKLKIETLFPQDVLGEGDDE